MERIIERNSNAITIRYIVGEPVVVDHVEDDDHDVVRSWARAMRNGTPVRISVHRETVVMTVLNDDAVIEVVFVGDLPSIRHDAALWWRGKPNVSPAGRVRTTVDRY